MNVQAIFGQHYSIECIQNTPFYNLYPFSFPKRNRFLFARRIGFEDLGENEKVADSQIFKILCNRKGLTTNSQTKRLTVVRIITQGSCIAGILATCRVVSNYSGIVFFFGCGHNFFNQTTSLRLHRQPKAEI